MQKYAGRLGAELRRRRLAAGLTQQALADRIRYDRSYLSQVETGTQVPAEQFILLCERELRAGGKLRAVLAETLGVELWDLARAMQASNVSDDMVEAMEASVLRLHQVHAKVSPTAMLPHLHEHLRAVTSLLQQPQPIRQRRRLCSIAGHLAGLRAWATFDLADREGARSWYELALQPAAEAEDDALCGWIFGAWSLLPSYDGQPADALTLIRRGQLHAARSADVTVQAWLSALAARAHAGLGDTRAFRDAQDEANQAIDHTRPEQRRHGMDFDGDRLGRHLLRGHQPGDPPPARACTADP